MSKEDDGVSTTTGATEKQIGDACREAVANYLYTTKSDAYPLIQEIAGYLVPPGMVIASAADVAKVPTAEEIAAMRVITDYLVAWRRLDETLDDDAVEAGKQFDAIVRAFGKARDAVSDSDVRMFRAYLGRVTG